MWPAELADLAAEALHGASAPSGRRPRCRTSQCVGGAVRSLRAAARSTAPAAHAIPQSCRRSRDPRPPARPALPRSAIAAAACRAARRKTTRHVAGYARARPPRCGSAGARFRAARERCPERRVTAGEQRDRRCPHRRRATVAAVRARTQPRPGDASRSAVIVQPGRLIGSQAASAGSPPPKRRQAPRSLRAVRPLSRLRSTLPCAYRHWRAARPAGSAGNRAPPPARSQRAGA